jgi:hypothetical protein
LPSDSSAATAPAAAAAAAGDIVEKAEKKTKKPAATKKSRKAESDAEEDVIFRGELRQGIDMFCVEWRRIQGPTDRPEEERQEAQTRQEVIVPIVNVRRRHTASVFGGSLYFANACQELLGTSASAAKLSCIYRYKSIKEVWQYIP